MAIIDVHAEVGTTQLWGIPFTDVNLARSMLKYGVERSVVSSTIGNSCDFQRGNAQVAKVTQANKSMLGCVVVNFNYPEALADRDAHLFGRRRLRGHPADLRQARQMRHAGRGRGGPERLPQVCQAGLPARFRQGIGAGGQRDCEGVLRA